MNADARHEAASCSGKDQGAARSGANPVQHRVPRVSVVVPTCRRRALLERGLDALSAQDLPPDEYELVVVHDGDNEAFLDFAAAYAERLAARGGPALRFVARPHAGPASARNAGWQLAAAPVIAFTDDDTVPDPSWLRRGLEVIDAGADAAWGRIIVPLPPDPTDYERDAAQLGEAGFVTANCFCRRQVLAAIGGFDERFRRAWREDSDLYFQLLDAGVRVVHAPEAAVLHPMRPARWGVSLSQQRKVLYDALLFKKHRVRYRAQIRRAPRWDYYLTVAALVAVPVGLASGAAAVAAAGAAGWAVLTGRFCAQRLRGSSLATAHVAEMAVTSALIPPLAVFWRFVGALRFRVMFL